jgi:hypothetical protein
MSGGGSLDSQFLATTGTLIFDLGGETVTYTVLGEPGTAPSGSSITAVRIATSDQFEPPESEQTAWLILASDVSNPTEGDTITDDGGEVWGVIRSAPQAGGCFYVATLHAKEN